jgi:hypothetical protein
VRWGDSPAAGAVLLTVVRIGVLSFASERLCFSWHGSSVECVFANPIKLQPAGADMLFVDP